MSKNTNKPLSENKTWQAIGAYAEAKEEIARLTAENERLRKAGDKLQGRILICLGIDVCEEDYGDDARKDIAAWDAAKEGRDAK